MKSKWMETDKERERNPSQYADKREGVYVMKCIKTNKIIYVGESTNLQNRFFSYAISTLMGKCKISIPYYFKFKYCNNSKELEKYFIQRLNPEYNYEYNILAQKKRKQERKEQIRKYGYHF